MRHGKVHIVTDEYWFCNGKAVACPGEHQELNHAGYVLVVLLGQLLCDLRKHTETASLADELAPLTEWDDGIDSPALRQVFNDWSDCEYRRGRISQEACDDIYGWICELIGWDERKLDIVLTDSREEARAWALRNWGWVRALGLQLQLYGLTGYKLEMIAKGLQQVYEDSYLQRQLFQLEDLHSKTFYRDVPYEVLRAAKPHSLVAYRV